MTGIRQLLLATAACGAAMGALPVSAQPLPAPPLLQPPANTPPVYTPRNDPAAAPAPQYVPVLPPGASPVYNPPGDGPTLAPPQLPPAYAPQPGSGTTPAGAAPVHVAPVPSPGASPANLAPRTVARPDSAGARQLQALLSSIVRKHIPHTFTDDRDWGGQSERWDGLHIRREGLFIKTKRRKKLVNHGIWNRYEATLENPNEELQVKLLNLRQNSNGDAEFDLIFTARVKALGRRARWVKGVQAYSLSAEARAQLELKLHCEMALQLDITELPPAILLSPQAKTADLQMLHFRLDNISKLGGEAAQQLGKGIELILEREVRHARPKIVKAINKEIAENAHKLRISMNDLLDSKWKGLGAMAR